MHVDADLFTSCCIVPFMYTCALCHLYHKRVTCFQAEEAEAAKAAKAVAEAEASMMLIKAATNGNIQVSCLYKGANGYCYSFL